MGAVEPDSVKSARKAKDKLHKACERASETHERTLHGQEQNRMHMASIRESRERQCSVSNQHISTITCTAAPRVWYFQYLSLFAVFKNKERRSRLHYHIYDFNVYIHVSRPRGEGFPTQTTIFNTILCNILSARVSSCVFRMKNVCTKGVCSVVAVWQQN